MKSCGVCGGARKAGGRVVVLGPKSGQLRTVLACKSCRDRSVTIAIAPLSSEGARKTLVLDDVEKQVREALRALARRMRGYARVGGPDASGLERASAMLDGAAKNPGERVLGS